MKTLYVMVALLIAGCANVGPSVPPVRNIVVPFDATQAKTLLDRGTNTIKGSALFRQKGGGVVTCAGRAVNLIPATEYAGVRFLVLYGTQEGGINYNPRVSFNPDPPEYYSLTKSTKCDAQGNFTFEEVADGEFFVQTNITWQVGYSLQGGNIFQKVRVSGGRVSSIVLSA